MGKRIDKVEYERRIFIIQGWIIEGVQYSLILRQIIQQGWTNANTEKNQLRYGERLLKAARERWTDIEEGNIDHQRRLKVAELQQYKRNLQEKYKGTPGGIRALMAVEKEIIKIKGLYKPSKVEITGADGQPIQTENTQTILYLPKNRREIANAVTNGN